MAARLRLLDLQAAHRPRPVRFSISLIKRAFFTTGQATLNRRDKSGSEVSWKFKTPLIKHFKSVSP